jgi:hypothetical protein
VRPPLIDPSEDEVAALAALIDAAPEG